MRFDFELWQKRMEQIHDAQLESYNRNWNYYNGKHEKPMAVRQGQPDDNVIINLARFVVDKGVAFLVGKDMPFELQEGELTKPEEYLENVWQANRKMTFLGKLATSGGVCGHVFIKIVPDGIREGVARLVNIDPSYVTVYWSPEDIDDVLRYQVSWTEVDRDGKPLYRRETIELVEDRWEVKNEIARSSSAWRPDPDNPDIAWPWPWPPMIHCQNIPQPHQFYGNSDLEDLALQDATNYVASNIQRIIRYHAHPKTWAKGFSAKDYFIGPDDIFVIPSDNGMIANLEMGSDLASSFNFLDLLIKRFLGAARVPRLDPTDISVGALSGFALRILYGDLLEKTEMKRRTYGDMLIELNRRLLEMGGFGGDNLCTIHWPNPLPDDPVANTERDRFELDYKLASIETVRSRRGLDHEAEQERIDAQEAAEGNIGAKLLKQFETNANNTGNNPAIRA